MGEVEGYVLAGPGGGVPGVVLEGDVGEFDVLLWGEEALVAEELLLGACAIAAVPLSANATASATGFKV